MRVERVGRGSIRRWVVGIAIAALAVTSGCGGGAPADSDGSDSESVVLSANVLGTPIATVVVEVTAADILQPLVFNLTVQNGIARGTIRLPPGLARTITVRGFDTLGQITHEGSKTIDVARGDNPPVSIAMIARTGDVPIIVQLGPVAIVVVPGSAAMSPGGTLQLTATITPPNGEVLPGPVQWATSNPAVATVDEDGLVTAVSIGPVTIVATYAGVAGTSAIAVGAGWTGVRQFGSVADDIVTGVALHAGSALYVVGRTNGVIDGDDLLLGTESFLAKFDLSGRRLWTRQVGDLGDWQASGVAVDAAGFVYVTGDYFEGYHASIDAYVEKIDPSGNLLWIRYVGMEGEERGGAVVVDAAGNVHAVGVTSGSLEGHVNLGGRDVFVATFDPNGNAIGTRQLGTPQDDLVGSATIDGAGTIYVLGGGNLMRIDPVGDPRLFPLDQWVSMHHYFSSIAVDGDGNQFLSGSITGGSGASGFLWKLDPFDVELWQWSSGFRPGGPRFVLAEDVALDTAGSAFVVGGAYSEPGGSGLDGNVSAGGYDAFLVKIDSAGNKLWTRQLGTPGEDHGRRVVVDGAGDAYVVGHTRGDLGEGGNAGGLDVFVAKYDRLGVKQ